MLTGAAVIVALILIFLMLESKNKGVRVIGEVLTRILTYGIYILFILLGLAVAWWFISWVIGKF